MDRPVKVAQHLILDMRNGSAVVRSGLGRDVDDIVSIVQSWLAENRHHRRAPDVEEWLEMYTDQHPRNETIRRLMSKAGFSEKDAIELGKMDLNDF